MSRLFLGFDFFGAGNIGDDLMLKGFIEAVGYQCNSNLICSLPKERLESQKVRLGQVEWHSVVDKERINLVSSCDHWLGVGGTPFQASGGPWLLNKISRDFAGSSYIKKWMIGVGCEEEVIQEEELAIRVANEVEHIWARDEKSKYILVNTLAVPIEKVTSGGDLAHISLRSIFKKNQAQDRREAVGIIYYSEKTHRNNDIAIKNFVKELLPERPVCFMANDVRTQKGFERDVYNKLFGGLRSLVRQRPQFISPDYNARNTSELVSHYSRFDTVIASRYHAILTAAWAGCRVVALDRSSKIRNLAEELDVPLVSSPFSVEALHDGLNRAKAVSRELLENKVKVAEQSVHELCGQIC